MTETKLERKTLGEWRKEAGLTQAELAELAGCDRKHISNIETGVVRPRGLAAQLAAEALDITISQIIRSEMRPPGPVDDSWWEDGHSFMAPTETLQWWRERRSLSVRQLSRLSGVSQHHIYKLERAEHEATFSTRNKLARVLKVAPDKLQLGSENAIPEQKRRTEDGLREDLRAARYALRRAFDFMREDYKIVNRYLDERDKALEVVIREMKGT